MGNKKNGKDDDFSKELAEGLKYFVSIFKLLDKITSIFIHTFCKETNPGPNKLLRFAFSFAVFALFFGAAYLFDWFTGSFEISRFFSSLFEQPPAVFITTLLVGIGTPVVFLAGFTHGEKVSYCESLRLGLSLALHLLIIVGLIVYMWRNGVPWRG